MSDDLVKYLPSTRLREQASRIEELETKLRQEVKDKERVDRVWAENYAALESKLRESALQELSALGQATEAYQAQLEAEAKLEKAVKALEEVQEFVRDLEPYADQGHTLVPALQKACETLNELKGQGND